jgi:carbonic anhydrase
MFTIGMGLSYEQYATFSPDYTEIVKRFKESHEFYKYTGSLTTPPCTEGVQWLVSAEPIFNISYQHVLQFQQKFGFNARDTKPLRYEADLDWVAARSAPEFLNPLSGDEVPEHSEYNGFDGSAYWQLSHPACGGNIQTPISFEPHSADSKAIGLVLDNSAHKYPGLQYPVEAKAAGTLKNMGETLKWSPSVAGSGTFTRPDGIYNLLQFHFHVPSEHRIDGVEYPMEIHFVHNQGSKLAVVGGFVQLGLSSSPFIFEMLEKGKLLKKGESAPFTPPFAEVVAKLKEAKTFFKYTGSLTTPPCTEGVKWLVAEEPILTVSPDHWKEFMELYEFSARDTQPLRYTANYDWISARKSDYFTS